MSSGCDCLICNTPLNYCDIPPRLQLRRNEYFLPVFNNVCIGIKIGRVVALGVTVTLYSPPLLTIKNLAFRLLHQRNGG
jgi:hypothetical protein